MAITGLVSEKNKEKLACFTPCGTIGLILSNTIPPGSPLFGGSKGRGNIRLISEKIKSPFTKLINPPKANKVDNPKTQRRETSFPKARKIDNGVALIY